MYSAGWRRFTTFCEKTQLSPIPATEENFLLFATSMAASKISHGSIKVYLSTIRHMHVLSGLHKNLSHQFTPQKRSSRHTSQDKTAHHCGDDAKNQTCTLPATTVLRQHRAVGSLLSKFLRLPESK